MSDTTGLRASIIEQAHVKGRQKLEQAQVNSQAEFSQQKEALIQSKTAQLQEQMSELKRSHQRELQQLENQLRQSTLAAKQTVLRELFAEAENKMINWSEAEHLAFFRRVMKAYPEPISVTFGSKTATLLSPESLVSLQEEFPYASFSQDQVSGEAGFVLRAGKVEMNYLYSTLLTAVWETESFRLASEIFTLEATE